LCCLETDILAYEELRRLTGSNVGGNVWIDRSQVSLFDMRESSVGTWDQKIHCLSLSLVFEFYILDLLSANYLVYLDGLSSYSTELINMEYIGSITVFVVQMFVAILAQKYIIH
jgi:hypothetical protein